MPLDSYYPPAPATGGAAVDQPARDAAAAALAAANQAQVAADAAITPAELPATLPSALADPASAFALPLTAATLRTLPVRLTDRPSVRDWGAVGDGASHPLGSAPFGLADIWALRALLPVGRMTLPDDKASRFPCTQTIGGVLVTAGAEWARISFNGTNGASSTAIIAQSAGNVFSVAPGGGAYGDGGGVDGKANVSAAWVAAISAAFVYVSNRLGAKTTFVYSDAQPEDETDWAACQLAHLYAGGHVAYPAGHYITNRPVKPTNGDGIYIPRGAWVDNTRPRNARVPQDFMACPFELGWLHPVIYNPTTPAFDNLRWKSFALNAVSAGDRVFTVTTPGGVTAGDIVVGEIIVIRSNNDQHQIGAGTGYLNGVHMMNRVLAWTPATGAIACELPVPFDIPSTGSTVPSDPYVGVNAGTDNYGGQDWRVARDIVFYGGGKVSGMAPFGIFTGAYNCRADIEAECQDMASLNAMTNCEMNVRGTYTERLLEIKQHCHKLRGSIVGTYRYDATVPPLTPVSVGEQSHDVDMTLDLALGREMSANVRAVEIYARKISFRGSIAYLSPSTTVSAVAVKSTPWTTNPPRNVRLDLDILGLGGVNSPYYFATLVDSGNLGYPTECVYDIRGRSVGVAPGFFSRHDCGTFLQERARPGSDVYRSQILNPGEVPEGASYIAAIVAGPVTYAAGTTTLVGGATVSFLGCKIGDQIAATLQQVGTVSAGTIHALAASAQVAGAGTVGIYVRNLSATDVTITGATALWVLVDFKRRR